MSHLYDMSFIGKKFSGLLGVASASMVVIFAMQFIDSAIIGNYLGENALAATNLINPIYSASAFAANIVAIGTGIFFTNAVGKFDKDGMARTVGQGVISAIGMGVLIAAIAVLGESAYLDFYSVSAEVRALAEDYYFFYIFVFATLPLYNVVYELVFEEGDELVCWISSGVQLAGNIVSSILLCQTMGIKGVGLGMLIGIVTSFLVLCAHFFRRTNTLRFRWFFSIRKFFEAAKYSLIDALYYLDIAVMQLVVSKFIVSHYGDRYLPVFTVVLNVISFELVLDGIGLALRPLLSVFRGEDNVDGQARLMRICTKTAIGEGLVVTVLLLCTAGLIPGLLGIDDAELVSRSAEAVRIMSVTTTFTSVAFLLSSYYLLIDKVGLGMIEGAVKDLLAPIIFGLLFATLGGKLAGMTGSISGLWIGFALGPVIAVAVTLVYVFLRYRAERSSFPWMFGEGFSIDGISSASVGLGPETKRIFSLEIKNFGDNEVVSLVQKLESVCALPELSIDRKTSMHLQLLTEECLGLIREKNESAHFHSRYESVRLRDSHAGNRGGSCKLCGECTLMVDSDAITYIIRDNGIIFDITDADNKVTSLRSMVLSSLMEHYSDKANLVTTSYNRNIFRFAR